MLDNIIASSIYLLVFLFAIFASFYIPGSLLLHKNKLNIITKITLSLIIGIVLFGWQGMIFGTLNYRWLTYIYLLFSLIIWLKLNFKNLTLNFIKIKKPYSKWAIFIILLIFIGSALQSSVIWPNGSSVNDGIVFCCGNTSDNLFHLALTNQLTKNFPPEQPGMAGELVKNYHYWSNLVVADLIRVFNLPLIQTQFQYFPLLISILLGLTAITFGMTAKIGKPFIVWLLFFLYFGGDLIYLIMYLNGKPIDFSMSSLEDGISFLENPPRAFSMVILLGGLSMLILWHQKKQWKIGMLMALVLGSLIGFKVYSGIFILSGFMSLIIYFLLIKKLKLTFPLIAAFILSAIIYFPVNQNAGGLYFTGFWMIENFIVQPALGLVNLELERRIFLNDNKWLRVLQYESMFFILFSVAIFGTKIIGIIQSKKSLSLLPKEINIALISGLIISAVGGFLFQQSSGGANTFNFLVSIFIIGSIYTALACYFWLSKFPKFIKYFFIILIIIITLPRTISSLSVNINQLYIGKNFTISQDELEAYKYLNKNGKKNPLIIIDSNGFDMNNDSPYISAFINGRVFLSGQGILKSHGINLKEREEFVNLIFKYKEKEQIKDLLRDKKIDYIITRTGSIFALKEVDFLTTFYKNKNITIYKTNL